MHIRYYGHSCFGLTASSGVKILTDPCAPEVGYTLKNIEADVVTISHDHYDHNYLEAVAGEPAVIRTAGVHRASGIQITGVESYHDNKQGALRGPNLMFVYEIDGMRVAHMGDLGAYPGEEAMNLLGKVHVLLVPVGGTYTITPSVACKLANALKTQILIPMHYQTPKLTLPKPLLEVESLLSIAKNCRIHKLNQADCIITPENLGEDRVLVLEA